MVAVASSALGCLEGTQCVCLSRIHYDKIIVPITYTAALEIATTSLIQLRYIDLIGHFGG